MDHPLSAMVPGNGCCMSGLWDVTVCKRFNLILKCYVFADILCRRSRTRSLQGSLQQRIDFVKAHVVWFHTLWWITVLLLPKNVYFSVKGFHSDLSIDDRSLINLGPHLHIWKQCDVISNVGWNGWANFWWVENQRLGARIWGGVWGSWCCH